MRLLSPRSWRLVTGAIWLLLLLGFWMGSRLQGDAPLELVGDVATRLGGSPWTPALLLGLYLLRPLLLVPITVVNLASGFLLGTVAGIGVALLGTLLSATVGYSIGRFMISPANEPGVLEKWRLARWIRDHSFEAVVAGGLMYLHADAVNIPAGVLRIRFLTFLPAVAAGNLLSLSAAVLAGAAVQDNLARARTAVELGQLLLAGLLLATGLLLAFIMRRHR